eukprot:NODE_2505_length_685_cov_75.941824_g2048_i0.p4 GENE.NODE_2505_length_685_cov_75.941824_g2048_i0~~NODE_2505_length_685_cov_75.941824_g2048_i0.p4  ORF type:complete len:57 (-),score=6.34 NODE_2505_length_685_cov_75.941824_g2048_i0:190-360(-)
MYFCGPLDCGCICIGGGVGSMCLGTLITEVQHGHNARVVFIGSRSGVLQVVQLIRI